MGLSRLVRSLAAPEASWRRPDPDFAAMAWPLSFLLAVPLYELPRKERHTVGRFHARSPNSAGALYSRVALECSLRASARGRSVEDSIALTNAILSRLFSSQAAYEIAQVGSSFMTGGSQAANQVEAISRILARASVLDISAVQGLTDYSAALKRGVELAAIDPSIAEQGEHYTAFVGKHWLLFGDTLRDKYEAWLTADGLQSAMDAVLRKLLK